MTAALEGGKWSAARPGRTLPPGKTRYPFYRRLGGYQGRSGRAENLVLTEIRSRTIQPGSSVAIPTELPGPKYWIVLCKIWSCYSTTSGGTGILALWCVCLPHFCFHLLVSLSPVRPIRLHLFVALTRGTNGRTWGTFQKATFFQKSQRDWRKIHWIFQLWSISGTRVPVQRQSMTVLWWANLLCACVCPGVHQFSLVITIRPFYSRPAYHPQSSTW